MSTMTLAERIFLLRRTRAFARLYDSELGSIASVCRLRVYEPGETVARSGRPLKHLHLVAEGRIVDEASGPLPSVFGATSLLTGQALDSTLTADPHLGARCLVISRPHFFTLVNEFPPLLMNLLEEWQEERGSA